MSTSEIKSFPEYTLHPDRVLYKIHKTIHDPRFFCDCGEHRFDLISESDPGTCYLALSPPGAFVEVFGRFKVLAQRLIDERSLSELTLTRALRLADVTHKSVIGRFGIAGDLSTGTDYREPQQWALRWSQAGFDGVFYAARHDPTFTERSVAVFGNMETGAKLFDVDTDPIPEELVEEVCRNFGFTVLPSAPLL